MSSAGHNDPRLLYSIPNIRAFHLQNGEEQPLTPSGPQTLSLLMVPTSSPFADLSTADPQSAAPEEDFYLHLHLPPELDLSLPATTQIYHQPPHSYLIPRWDLGPESGAFTRIEFPKIGSGPDRVTQEDVDTFETILAQCTAFLERAQAPTGKAYNPRDYAPGEGYVSTPGDGGSDEKGHHGRIVLIDEENGSVVGELSEGFDVVEGSDVKHGSKGAPPVVALPSFCANISCSSCRDWPATRRPREPDQCQQCVRRIPSNGKAPSLQELHDRPKRRSGLAVDCDGVRISGQCHKLRGVNIHAKDQTKPETYDLLADYSREGEEVEQPHKGCC